MESMVRKLFFTIPARQKLFSYQWTLESSPFYGLSAVTREKLVSHVREWPGSRVKATKKYKELIKALDGLPNHPILWGGCDLLAQGLMDYHKYNSNFFKAEMAYAIQQEEKQSSAPRKSKITQGNLAEIKEINQERSDIFAFKCNSLPTSHSFKPGQMVKALKEGCEQGRGLVVQVNFDDDNIIVDFTDDSPNNMNHIFNISPCDIEIASDLVVFFCMEKCLQDLAKYNNGKRRMPLWLIIFLESMNSKKKWFLSLSDKLRAEVEDINDLLLAHNKSERKLDLPSLASVEDYDGHDDLPLNKKKVQENLQKFMIEYRGKPLNHSQQHALIVSLSSYLSLIQGPPGCGKTHTAACIMKIWQQSNTNKNKKALVVAQSNKAVDQLCAAMLSVSLDIICIGTAPRIQQNIHHIHFDEKFQKMIKLHQEEDCGGYANTGKSKRDLITMLFSSADVICTTCIGSCHKSMKNHVFSNDIGLIVMDEATQASELECLVPFTAYPHAQIIMIGDHKQLPPTILSDKLKREEHEYSLFGQLIAFGAASNQENNAQQMDFCTDSFQHDKAARKEAKEKSDKARIPSLFASTMLMEQYQMHPEISVFPNKQFYAGILLDGVRAEQRPLLQPFSLWPTISNSGLFPRQSCVAFIPTNGKEVQTSSMSFSNAKEAEVVASVAQQLVKGGLRPKELGVISPYMGQVIALKHALQKTTIPVTQGRKTSSVCGIVEVNTVDAFQGSKKEVIIISTVRANDYGKVGFLKDPRWMNVALTRANRGLVVVGNPGILRNDPNWKAWLDHCMAYYI